MTGNASPPRPISVIPATPAEWPGLAALFAQPGDPKWCWCMHWRSSSAGAAHKTTAQRRSEFEALVAGELAPGVVALDGDEVVGWCSIGPRMDFERLQRSRTIRRVDDRPVWAIVCFVVAKASRGRGLTRRLIEGAVDFAAASGASTVEAYPVDPGDTRMGAAYAYTGTLPMFLEAGFAVVAPTTSVSNGHPRVVVRRELG